MCICGVYVVWARAFNFKPIIIIILSIAKVIYTHHSPRYVYSKCFWLFNDLNNFKFMQKYQQQQQQKHQVVPEAAAIFFCLYLFLVFNSLPPFRHFFSVWYFIFLLLYLYFYFIVSVISREKKLSHINFMSTQQ